MTRPATSARPFTELDGTRGSVVYVEHHIERPLFDGRYLREWTRAARSARDRDGSPAVVAGAAPVVADLVDAISHSGPIAVAVALGATLLLLLIGFKRLGDRALALMAHALGILWMVAAMAALE
ncbi:MAG: hypothetical protein K8F58_06605, partial [Bauldia sp.]|nr:hypothetical protein [Bauldia sp.]